MAYFHTCPECKRVHTFDDDEPPYCPYCGWKSAEHLTEMDELARFITSRLKEKYEQDMEVMLDEATTDDEADPAYD